MNLALLGLLGLLILRLAHLQLVQGEHYRGLAEKNRLRVMPEQAPRGLILDR
jgi:penicillin-binding protein 2